MVGNYLIRGELSPAKRTPAILATALAILVSFPPTTPAAEEASQLDAVTVTAERFPVKEKDSPRFVTVITSEELKESGANNLVDALNRVGGFSYKAFGPLGISHGGMNSTLSIRGVKDGELILVNGVPIQGVAGHAYDLDAIPVEQIERIEILKGAGSTLYGADAMSGVINIITKRTGEKTSVTGAVEFGNESWHHHRLSATLPGLNVGFVYQHLGRQEEISRSFSKKYRYDLDDTNLYSWNLNATLLENFHVDWLGSHTETGFENGTTSPPRPSREPIRNTPRIS